MRAHQGFHAACESTLSFLQARLGFGLWMVTRVQGPDWIVLRAQDSAYGVRDGDVFAWADTFCCRMVQGLGPAISPRSGDIPAYACAPIALKVPIGAYIGQPLRRANGALFGTLCAIDPHPQPPEIQRELPLLEALGSLLATAAELESQLADARRALDLAADEAERDPLTGLRGALAWAQGLAAEEQRCKALGETASVMAVRLCDAGPGAAQRCAAVAEALSACVGPRDLVARMGGDEFALLSPQRDERAAAAWRAQVEQALAAAGLAARVGQSQRDPRSTLADAWELAKSRAAQAMAAR